MLKSYFNIDPTYLVSLESNFESCKTVKNVIHVLLLLKAAVDQGNLKRMRPGGQFVERKTNFCRNK